MLKIQLFGKYCVRRGEQALDGLDARKVQELLCYLLLHRDHALSRETLASLLWPETTTALSKKNLRQILWQLQTALGSQLETFEERVLVVEPDWVSLNPRVDLWLDVVVFEQAFETVQRLPGQRLDAQSVQIVEHAVQLYQGPLLEGWYQDWCLTERERLQSMYLAMLDKLMTFYEARGAYEISLSYGMRIMCYDRARERTHRQLMRLHYVLGDRAEALRQYERCTQALDEELGVAPSKSTTLLYKQICADQLDDPVTAIVEDDTFPELPSCLLLEVLHYLTSVQETLTDLQDQVQKGIQAVEMVLSTHL